MEKLVHLGDLEVVLPLAAALASWLLAARAWRITLRWLLLFGAALCLVGVTKIAFLGWGTGLHALDFKAISGHATSVTALYPFLAYIVLYRPDLASAAAGRRSPTGTAATAVAGAPTVPGNTRTAGLRDVSGAKLAAGTGNERGSGNAAGTKDRRTAYPLFARIGLLAGLSLGGIVSATLVMTGEHSVAEALAGWLLGASVSVGSTLNPPDLGGGRMLPTVWWTIPVFGLTASLMESAHVGYWMIRMALALSGSERPYSWDTCG